MCRFLFIVLLLGFFAPTPSHSAEDKDSPSFNPETILLSHFSLTRPKQWQWISTGPHEGSILMEVIFSAADPHDLTNPVMIFFNHAKPGSGISTPGATAQRWKTWFSEVKTTSPLSKPKQIGTNAVCFVEFTGNYHGLGAPGKTPKPHPGYTLFGAHIEDGEGNILIRMVGPTNSLKKHKAALTTMIEEMLEPK